MSTKKLTEEEKAKLEHEAVICKTNLKKLSCDLREIAETKEFVWKEFTHWRDKFNTIDRKLAFDDRLTIIKGKTKDSIVGQLKNLLKDKDKLKELIKVLEDEKGK